MSDPWMKFYPRDWRGDQALRAVSLSARGLWIECLCIMHEAKPYGHLVLNGAPVGGDTLARMTGVPVDEVTAMLAELRQAGVLSVTGKGVIFSRRMTKDHARAQKGRKAAKIRWSQTSDDVEQSEEPNGSPNGLPITQKPEARNQIVIEPLAQHTVSKPAPRELDQLSERLLQAAGLAGFREERNIGLINLAPILDLIAQGYDLDRDIIPAVQELGRRGKRFKTWAYIVPFVIERAAQRAAIPPKAAEPEVDWKARLDVWQADGTWAAAWGPPPNAKGCRAPPELIGRAA